MGDKDLSAKAWEQHGFGIFTNSLSKKLVFKEADVVVHSYKDLPVKNLNKTSFVCLKRDDPRDIILIKVNSYGAFLVAHESAKRMIKSGQGNIFFTGSSASIKGFAKSASFAIGKFGLRGLAQSLARELHPHNIHIGHFVIDGGIGREPIGNYQMIHPDEIAKQYFNFYQQDKKAWSWEIEIRTNTEKF